MSAQPDDGNGTDDGIHRGDDPPVKPAEATEIASSETPAPGTGGPLDDWVHRGTTTQA